ncbi:MAG: choice-of-anchor M domain-containing protein [Propioniciclava sp.]|uniref:choice-of-anchor M domain-containing protein n=1 Tax=Propioniciclava sp. TaxID=2038686 RepID=UPI0039E2E897
MRMSAPARRPASRLSRLRAGIALLTLALLAGPAAVASAQGPDDAALKQALSPDMRVVTGERVLDRGHVDMGPKFVDGAWKFLIHDDVARADAGATSVWRYPDQTVLHVLDQGKLTVPDDPAYAFLGAKPGEPVWVVPQTQNPEVVWLGWNTQDPEVMRTINRGITLSLTGVQGPGVVTTYLQSGSFGEPQLLFDSRVPGAQPAWVDVNTHTHANWVFTQPGVYLLRLTADADLIDGTSVTDTQLIRVAVGTATAPADALAATWTGPDDAGASPSAAPGSGQPAADGQPAASGSSSPLVPILIGAIVVVAAGLVAGVVIVVVRGNRAKRRVLTEHRTSPADASPGTASGQQVPVQEPGTTSGQQVTPQEPGPSDPSGEEAR